MDLNPPAVWFSKTTKPIYKVSSESTVKKPISSKSISAEQLVLSGAGNKGKIHLYALGSTFASTNRYNLLHVINPDESYPFPIPSSGKVDLGTIYFTCNPGDALSGNYTGASSSITLVGSGDELCLANGTTTAVAAGTVGDISTGTNGVMQMCTLGHKSRVRQDGTIRRVQFYVGTMANVTELRVQIWRRTTDAASPSGTYTLVGQSEDLSARCRTTAVNTLDLEEPITGVQQGDYWGTMILSNSTGTALTLRAESLSGCTMGFWRNIAYPGTPKRPQALWESSGIGYGSLGALPIVGLYMDAPVFSAIGDSLVAGHNTGGTNFQTYLEAGPAWTTDNSFVKNLAGLYGVNYQNLGIGSQTSTQISARIADLTISKCKFAILQGGVNDIAALGAGPYTTGQSTFITNYTAMLNAVISAGMIPIVIKLLPWTAGTTAQMTARDLWNAALASLCAASYPTALVCDIGSAVGQQRSAESTYWDIQPAYDSDGIHLTDAGYATMAARIKVLLDAYCTTNNLSI